MLRYNSFPATSSFGSRYSKGGFLQSVSRIHVQNSARCCVALFLPFQHNLIRTSCFDLLGRGRILLSPRRAGGVVHVNGLAAAGAFNPHVFTKAKSSCFTVMRPIHTCKPFVRGSLGRLLRLRIRDKGFCTSGQSDTGKCRRISTSIRREGRVIARALTH